MKTIKEAVSPSDNTYDDLQAITDIGPKFADALRKIGIQHFSDLACHTPEELSKALIEQTNVNVSPARIEAKNWIGQASEKAQQVSSRCNPHNEGSEGRNQPEAAPNHPVWRQHADFSVFFDHITDEHGERIWQTRVYDGKSGDEEPLSGLDPALWVNWILDRAELPLPSGAFQTETTIAAEPTPSEGEPGQPTEQTTIYEAGIEITDVQMPGVKAASAVQRKQLMVEVQFQISGSEAETLAAERGPFWIQVHGLGLENGALKFSTSKRGKLEPHKFEYTVQFEFPVPALGRYELQSLVLLPPPVERMALYEGPKFRLRI